MTFVLGLIPARGGSKRIPRKNIRPLNGVPLLAWTLNAARFSQALDDFVVSSEDQEIIETARSWGANVIRRPAELASDTASSYGLMLHALDSYPRPVDYLVLLQPTSPFRLPVDIDQCVWRAELDQMPAVSVTWGRNVPNGAVYVAPVSWLRETLALGITHPFDTETPVKVWMPQDRSDDIDTEDDWARAERKVMGAAA